MPQKSSQNDLQSLLDQFEGNVDQAVEALRRTAKQKATTKKVRKNTNPVVVSVESVSKRYKVGSQKVEALKNVSLEVREGEFLALSGPSGSGKSTLLHLIGALDKPSEGKVTVNGQDIGRLNSRQLSVFRNQTIGFVFQFFYLQPFLNLATNLEVPGMFAHTKAAERKARVEMLAEKVGLSERLQHLPKELSGGQMQRAAIARALLNNPKIILADEPTGNLDSTNGRAIIDLFDEIRNSFGTTIIVVSHDPKITGRADREIILADGEIKL